MCFLKFVLQSGYEMAFVMGNGITKQRYWKHLDVRLKMLTPTT